MKSTTQLILPTLALSALALSLILSTGSALAQEVLPFPEPPMGGKVEATMQESVHKWREQPRHLPKDAPNILIVMMDDAGFGQVFSPMIFFQDKRAFEEFTGGNFEFDAGVSAVAITAGVQAKAGTEGATAGASAGPATGVQAKVNYHKGMAVFVHAKGGLVYEATVGGQKCIYTPVKKN
jgi:hypothetical protein